MRVDSVNSHSESLVRMQYTRPTEACRSGNSTRSINDIDPGFFGDAQAHAAPSLVLPYIV